MLKRWITSCVKFTHISVVVVFFIRRSFFRACRTSNTPCINDFVGALWCGYKDCSLRFGCCVGVGLILRCGVLRWVWFTKGKKQWRWGRRRRRCRRWWGWLFVKPIFKGGTATRLKVKKVFVRIWCGWFEVIGQFCLCEVEVGNVWADLDGEEGSLRCWVAIVVCTRGF